MFWYLLFAHLLADYPLQSNWMVMQKMRFSILLLHVVIHLGTLLVVVGAARSRIWHFLVLLALIHLVIDLVKNAINKIRPRWVIGPYLTDQILHYLTIWLVATLIENQTTNLPLPLNRTVFIFASAYLLVTYVWFISERILAYTDLAYRKEVIEQIWVRMASRAAILSGFLLIWRWVLPVTVGATVTSQVPYFRSKNGIRALVTDVGVSVAGLVLIVWAL